MDAKNFMIDLLKKISQLAIELGDPMRTISEYQRKSGWLGEPPATVEEIKAVENKLNVKLPPDYKTFVMLSNGFASPIDTEPTFEKLSDIDFLKNIDQNLVEIWNKDGLVDIAKTLSRSILIAGINEEQYFLLVPPFLKEDKWKYWKFANWIPEEEPYPDLQTYLRDVLKFMKDKSTE